jgi:hypothetical protein
VVRAGRSCIQEQVQGCFVWAVGHLLYGASCSGVCNWLGVIQPHGYVLSLCMPLLAAPECRWTLQEDKVSVKADILQRVGQIEEEAAAIVVSHSGIDAVVDLAILAYIDFTHNFIQQTAPCCVHR